MWLPGSVVVFGLCRFFDTRLAVVGGQGHANAAVDEMKVLMEEFGELLRQADRPSLASEVLYPRPTPQSLRRADRSPSGPPRIDIRVQQLAPMPLDRRHRISTGERSAFSCSRGQRPRRGRRRNRADRPESFVIVTSVSISRHSPFVGQ